MNLLGSIYNWFEYPPRLSAVRHALGGSPELLLDVGCGNHSPAITKRHFPHCRYHALDRAQWNLDRHDKAATDAFFRVDLEQPGQLSAVEDERYDAVICSHVLEHLTDPYAVVRALAAKVKRGGVLYVEVPSPRSARLPRAANGWYGIKGCLNFEDDPTHRTMVELPVVRDLLLECGFRVGRIGGRRLWRRLLLLPAYATAGIALRGYLPASVVWEISGFAATLLAARPQSPLKRNGEPQ